MVRWRIALELTGCSTSVAKTFGNLLNSGEATATLDLKLDFEH